ncbi:hypothetical protein KFL_005480010, partial [Klebsormidium nitens]
CSVGVASGLASLPVAPPCKENYGRVGALIADLSSQHGTPPFSPHVTVLGGFGDQLDQDQVLARTRALAAQVAPYRCRVADVACGSSYFQMVYLRMHKDAPVLNAHAASVSCFQVAPSSKPAYMPHMSLLYGDLANEVREQVVEAVAGQHKDLLVDTEFLVRSFHLYRTDPTDLLMKTWEEVAVFPLSGHE